MLCLRWIFSGMHRNIEFSKIFKNLKVINNKYGTVLPFSNS